VRWTRWVGPRIWILSSKLELRLVTFYHAAESVSWSCWRKLRRIAKHRPRTFGRFLLCQRPCGLVGLKVENDIATPEFLNQTPLHVSQEHFSIHGPVDRHRSRHFIVPQSDHEGDRFPCFKWDVADRFGAPRSPAPEAHHTAIWSIDSKQVLLSDPTLARAGYLGVLPFHGLPAFFAGDIVWIEKMPERAAGLVRMRCLCSIAMVSTEVRSGCSAITANICTAGFSGGETLLLAQRCNHFIAELANAQQPLAKKPRLHGFDNVFSHLTRPVLRPTPPNIHLIGRRRPKPYNGSMDELYFFEAAASRSAGHLDSKLGWGEWCNNR
jgi:hypothetical protein